MAEYSLLKHRRNKDIVGLQSGPCRKEIGTILSKVVMLCHVMSCQQDGRRKIPKKIAGLSTYR